MSTEDTREAIEVAHRLVAMGVPVFVARPVFREGERDWKGGTGGCGYYLPSGWQTTRPDPANVDAWRPGDALCAVMGHGLDLLDIDPRNGGDGSRENLQGRGVWPRVYAVASTPSGGSHEFIASIGVRSRDSILPGLDVKAGLDGKGHGFAFIAPTEKLSKATGEVSRYAWITAPKAPESGDDSGAALRDEIERVRKGALGSSGTSTPSYIGRIGDPIPMGEHHFAMRDFIWKYRCSLSEPETRILAHRRAVDCRPATWTSEMTDKMVSEAYAKAPDSPPPYSWTETGNAERVLDTFGGRLHYCAAIGWLAWSGVAWEVCERGEVPTAIMRSAKAAKRAAEQEQRAAEAAGDVATAERAAAAAGWWSSSLSARRIDDTEKILRVLPGVQIAARDLDTHPELLACRNGTVELLTGELRAHNPDDLLTVALDVDFSPSARSPRWEAFLESCFPERPEMVAYLRRLVGYALTGYSTEQVYVVHHGSGANGKSVFTSTLHKVFRPITSAVDINSLLARRSPSDASAAAPDIAALRSARLVITSEAEHGAKLNEARVKALTGGDPITVRQLYREPFTFTPGFLIMLSTNALPDIRGRDEGIWRRTKVVDWEEEFLGDRANPRLGAELLEEAEGILAWAVAGAREWHTAGCLGEPPQIAARVGDYRAQTDVLAGFYPGALVDDRDGFLSRPDVYRAYCEWSDEEGLQRSEVWRREALFKALRERRVEETKRGGNRGFRLRRRRHGEQDPGDRGALGAPGAPVSLPSLRENESGETTGETAALPAPTAPSEESSAPRPVTSPPDVPERDAVRQTKNPADPCPAPDAPAPSSSTKPAPGFDLDDVLGGSE